MTQLNSDVLDRLSLHIPPHPANRRQWNLDGHKLQN
jgi:hypothetical protein